MSIWNTILGWFKQNKGMTSFKAQLSSYGYPSDPYMDSGTAAGLGNANNRLQPGVIAINPEAIKQYGLVDGDILQIVMDDSQNVYSGYLGDTTGAGLKNNRVDVFDYSQDIVLPADNGKLGTVTILMASPKLSGTSLDQLGPVNLKRYAPEGSRHG